MTGNKAQDKATGGHQSSMAASLNEEQIEAVKTVNGPLLVVAGPGSGKTAVLTRRIAHMVIGGHVQARNILAMTFTNKAAGEMRDRVTGLMAAAGLETEKVWIHTFHGFCSKILRIEHLAAGIPSAYTIFDSADAKAVVQSVVRELHKEQHYDTPRKLKELVSSISRLKNGGFVRTSDDFTAVYSEYCLRLRRMGALDFDDLIGKTYDLFENNPQILDKYVNRFTHILIDEYQDTNPMQYNLMNILTARNRNICVVGDMDQSIYGFRMATPEIMQTFLKDFPETKIVNLTINYRSTPGILDVAYSIIEGNASEHRARLSTGNDEKGKVTIVTCRDPDTEARFVSESIGRLDKSLSVGVLMRTNAQSRKLETSLPAYGVVAQTVGTLRFYDRAEIKDVFSYLRLSLNPRDALAFARAVGAPKRGLGAKAVAEIVDAMGDADTQSTLERMLDGGLLSGQKAEKWTAFLHEIRSIQECMKTSGLVAAVKLILDQGLAKYTADSDTEQIGKAENLLELVVAAEEFTRKQPTHEDGTYKTNVEVCEEFLTACSLSSGEDSAEETDKTRAYLMSVHAAKGKEFDAVFVIGCEEGMFPHVKGNAAVTGKLNSEYEAEERRLLFVAATRARSMLCFTHAECRLVGDTFKTDIPLSRYLQDVPRARVDYQRYGTNDAARWGGSKGRGYETRAQKWGKGPSAVPYSSDAALSLPKKPETHTPRLLRETIFVGCSVSHSKFGQGTIRKIDGSGEDSSVTIKFGEDLRIFKLSATPLTLTA